MFNKSSEGSVLITEEEPESRGGHLNDSVIHMCDQRNAKNSFFFF